MKGVFRDLYRRVHAYKKELTNTHIPIDLRKMSCFAVRIRYVIAESVIFQQRLGPTYFDDSGLVGERKIQDANQKLSCHVERQDKSDEVPEWQRAPSQPESKASQQQENQSAWVCYIGGSDRGAAQRSDSD